MYYIEVIAILTPFVFCLLRNESRMTRMETNIKWIKTTLEKHVNGKSVEKGDPIL